MEIKMKNRFSIKLKLLVIFGLLVALSVLILGVFAMQFAKKAVTEKVEVQLIDKASDTAEIIDGRVEAFAQFLDGFWTRKRRSIKPFCSLIFQTAKDFCT